MFRTRDFLLLFTSIIFLLVAISSTHLINSNSSEDKIPVRPSEVQNQEYTATIIEDTQPTREERLAALRQKIADSEDIYFEEPQIEDDTELLTNAATSSESEVFAETLLCPGYAPYSGVWNPASVVFEEREGVLMVVEKSLNEGVATTSSSSTQNKVLVQLTPLNTSLSAQSCLSSDVVGIAQDGSLIRNDEASVYRIFDDNTQIGYALDGFPIYGASQASLDQCGGHLVQGHYRYQLSPARDNVLNCFSGVPAQL